MSHPIHRQQRAVEVLGARIQRNGAVQVVQAMKPLPFTPWPNPQMMHHPAHRQQRVVEVVDAGVQGDGAVACGLEGSADRLRGAVVGGLVHGRDGGTVLARRGDADLSNGQVTDAVDLRVVWGGMVRRSRSEEEGCRGGRTWMWATSLMRSIHAWGVGIGEEGGGGRRVRGKMVGGGVQGETKGGGGAAVKC